MIRTTLLLPLLSVSAFAAEPLKPRSARASSELKGYPAKLAIDGKVSDASRWVSAASDQPAWLEVELGGTRELGGVHLFTGYGEKDVIAGFKIQFRKGGKWLDIPSAGISGNTRSAVAVPFDQTVKVETDALRLLVVASHQGMARVKELSIFPATPEGLPRLPGPSGQEEIPEIYLNQSGFNLGMPKRFTAPGLADGTRFIVRPESGGAALAEGTLAGGIGDFSGFNPDGDGGPEFVVEAGGRTSEPFRVGRNWLERVSYQNAVNFMIDSRHYVGNSRGVCRGSFGWRDDHHFGWELHTLVPQWLSNPSAYERMPRQVKYEKPADPKLWGALEPYDDSAPDIVKLIHWGADIIVTQKLGHEHLKAQLAYFLYAWPALEEYLPAQNFKAVSDYAWRTWAEEKKDRDYPYDESSGNNLLALKTRTGSTKGSLPPGFSVEPNLLMHEAAKRAGRPDADLYFDAAVQQAAWLVKNLDWNDPLVTKGQRMSEWLTVTGLARLLRDYPDRAPEGLAAKLDAWAAVVVRRSANLWDFRKLDDKDGWTPMGEKPQMWNEPGNVVGLPAPILAAREFITDSARRERLDQLVWSHFDAMFGRNPVGRHFSYDAPREVEGVEHGWFSFYPGGIGQLAEARFVIDGSPKNGHFPYHPEIGNVGWTEGWIQFNTAFNISLAYLAWTGTKVEMARQGDELVLRLTAPLDHDYAKVESGTLVVTTANGDRERVTVTEDTASAATFTGRIRLARDQPAAKGDGRIQFPKGSEVRAAHGFGTFGREATLRP